MTKQEYQDIAHTQDRPDVPNPKIITNQEWCQTEIKWQQGAGNRSAYGGCPTEGICDDPATRDSWIPNGSTPIVTLRLKFNVFANDDGSSPAATQAAVDAQMVQLNADFAPSRIQFTAITEFINDTTYRQFADSEEFAMKNAWADSPATQLNVYVVNIQAGYLGVGTFPWENDATAAQGGLIIDDNWFGAGQKTLTHEVGHCVGLWHTHHGVSEVATCSACWERADGLNGDTTGDFAADTDPTPVNYNCSPPGGSDTCSSTAWGATDPQNYMGYAPDSCYTEFSPDQWGRMHCWTDDQLTGWIDSGGGDPTGACCVGQSCSITTAAACGGTYQGDGTDCSGSSGNPTTYNGTVNGAIPDGGGPGNPISHTITVNDTYTVGDVNLGVDVTHTWVGDLIVTVSHGGTTVTVIDRMGYSGSGFGCGSDNMSPTLDDEGTGGAIESQCVGNLSSPPNYTPNQALSAFDGMSAQGDWIITVSDNATQDTGTLDSWSLTLEEQTGGPCSGGCGSDAECDDGVFCNGAETCSGGTCQSGTAVNCNDGIACTTDSCNESTDQCDNVPNNGACDDGLFCNGAETCSAAVGCQSGSDPCPGQFCVEASDSCVDCLSNGDCDDGLFCNGAETCSGGSCVAGSDPCPGQGCDEGTDTCGGCGVDADCDDGDACTVDTCTGGVCSNVCSASVSSYPYDEDFEAGQGAWSNVGGDTFDWTRRSGSTPSSNTGPSGDHTTGSGFYMYIETSSPRVQGDTAVLEGPCFDLSGAATASLDFWYHMYGASMGTLNVEASTDCSTWTNVFSLSGNQGNAWFAANVDLTAYAGDTVKIRFVGIRGSSWQGDVSIDDISVTTGSGCSSDAECDDGQFCNGAETCSGGACQAGSDPCPGQGCNESTDTCGGCGVDADCDDGDACTVDICSGGVCSNDCAASVATYPYSESYDSSLGAWGNVGGDDFDWTRRSGSTPSSNTGPSGDHTSGSGFYVYTETSSPRVQGDTAILDGPCFDLSGASGATLTFWYHMYGASMGTLEVEASTDCVSWATVFSLSGDQGNTWFEANVDLSSYAGGTVSIRFVGIRGSSWQGDIAIDDVSVDTGGGGGCVTDADCDDGLFCNGPERCSGGSCLPAQSGVSNGTINGSAAWTSNIPVAGTITYNNQLQVVGPDAGSGGFTWASQSGVSVNGASLEFDLISYSSSDSGQWDYPVFYLNGTYYGLNSNGTLGAATTGGNGNGGTVNNGAPVSTPIHYIVDIDALAGSSGPHTIGFGVNSADGSFGAGTAVFDNITPPNDADPCPGQSCNEANDSCF